MPAAAPHPPLVEDVHLPSIDGLRAFETVARLGSLERAGEALAITASAVGKRVSTLEDLLGITLFSRSARGLTLTAAGKEYLAQVRTALGLLAAVPLHRRGARQRQRLRVCAPPTFARQILVPALPAFTALRPEIELEVVLSTPFLDGATPEADVEILHAAPGTTGTTLLMRDVVVPLAAPALMRQHGLIAEIDPHGRPRPSPLTDPAGLRDWPLLRTPVEPWTPWLHAAGLDWPEPDEGHRLVDLGLTLEAAAGGQGVALARPALARPWLRAGTLLPLARPAIEPGTQYLARTHGSYERGDDFVAWLAQVSAAAAAEGLALISGLA